MAFGGAAVDAAHQPGPARIDVGGIIELCLTASSERVRDGTDEVHGLGVAVRRHRRPFSHRVDYVCPCASELVRKIVVGCDRKWLRTPRGCGSRTSATDGLAHIDCTSLGGREAQGLVVSRRTAHVQTPAAGGGGRRRSGGAGRDAGIRTRDLHVPNVAR